jgi:ribonuclease HI
MEAMAIREGIRLTAEKGYNQVIIESGSQLGLNLCNVDEYKRSEIRSICQEIREITRTFD